MASDREPQVEELGEEDQYPADLLPLLHRVIPSIPYESANENLQNDIRRALSEIAINWQVVQPVVGFPEDILPNNLDRSPWWEDSLDLRDMRNWGVIMLGMLRILSVYTEGEMDRAIGLIQESISLRERERVHEDVRIGLIDVVYAIRRIDETFDFNAYVEHTQDVLRDVDTRNDRYDRQETEAWAKAHRDIFDNDGIPRFIEEGYIRQARGRDFRCNDPSGCRERLARHEIFDHFVDAHFEFLLRKMRKLELRQAAKIFGIEGYSPSDTESSDSSESSNDDDDNDDDDDEPHELPDAALPRILRREFTRPVPDDGRFGSQYKCIHCGPLRGGPTRFANFEGFVQHMRDVHSREYRAAVRRDRREMANGPSDGGNGNRQNLPPAVDAVQPGPVQAGPVQAGPVQQPLGNNNAAQRLLPDAWVRRVLQEADEAGDVLAGPLVYQPPHNNNATHGVPHVQFGRLFGAVLGPQEAVGSAVQQHQAQRPGTRFGPDLPGAGGRAGGQGRQPGGQLGGQNGSRGNPSNNALLPNLQDYAEIVNDEELGVVRCRVPGCVDVGKGKLCEERYHWVNHVQRSHGEWYDNYRRQAQANVERERERNQDQEHSDSESEQDTPDDPTPPIKEGSSTESKSTIYTNETDSPTPPPHVDPLNPQVPIPPREALREWLWQRIEYYFPLRGDFRRDCRVDGCRLRDVDDQERLITHVLRNHNDWLMAEYYRDVFNRYILREEIGFEGGQGYFNNVVEPEGGENLEDEVNHGNGENPEGGENPNDEVNSEGGVVPVDVLPQVDQPDPPRGSRSRSRRRTRSPGGRSYKSRSRGPRNSGSAQGDEPDGIEPEQPDRHETSPLSSAPLTLVEPSPLPSVPSNLADSSTSSESTSSSSSSSPSLPPRSPPPPPSPPAHPSSNPPSSDPPEPQDSDYAPPRGGRGRREVTTAGIARDRPRRAGARYNQAAATTPVSQNAGSRNAGNQHAALKPRAAGVRKNPKTTKTTKQKPRQTKAAATSRRTKTTRKKNQTNNPRQEDILAQTVQVPQIPATKTRVQVQIPQPDPTELTVQNVHIPDIPTPTPTIRTRTRKDSLLSIEASPSELLPSRFIRDKDYTFEDWAKKHADPLAYVLPTGIRNLKRKRQWEGQAGEGEMGLRSNVDVEMGLKDKKRRRRESVNTVLSERYATQAEEQVQREWEEQLLREWEEQMEREARKFKAEEGEGRGKGKGKKERGIMISAVGGSEDNSDDEKVSAEKGKEGRRRIRCILLRPGEGVLVRAVEGKRKK